MKDHRAAGALALATCATIVSAQAPTGTREAHCAAARAAAGTEYLALFNRFVDICGAEQPQRGGGSSAMDTATITAARNSFRTSSDLAC